MNTTEHLLTCLSEEAMEVGQAVSKALRFGLDAGYPGEASTNREDILKEITELLAVFEMLVEREVLTYPTDNEASNRMLKGKKQRVERYMTYARNVGTLVD